MAATVNWCEDHGAATGSPPKGTTRDGFGASTNYAVNCNWKNADDTNATAYTAAALGSAPAASYEKFQYLKFTGTFNSISNLKWTPHGNWVGSLNALFIFLFCTVRSLYTTPAATLNASLTVDCDEELIITSGLPVLMSTTGPEGASPTATLSAAGYSQYLVSQLSTKAGVATGTTPSITSVATWDED